MKAKVYQPTPTNLRRLAMALRRGDLVGIPTETVYGLAADALNPAACAKIFKAKQRPTNDPLIVHVLNLADAEKLAEFNPVARKIAKKFWPGPLTLVLPKKTIVPTIVTSGGDTVAIRAPAHPVARGLLRQARIPLAAPSANVFGYISPTEANHVADGLGQRIKYIVDGGACGIGVESTILDLTDPRHPRVLRPGCITTAALAKFLRIPISGSATRRSSTHERQIAPGMLSKHYSPRTKLRFWEPGMAPIGAKCGMIYLRRPKDAASAIGTHWLSERGSLAEIARNLYRVLREADRANYHELVVERLPKESGELAVAINDRLTRAAAKR